MNINCIFSARHKIDEDLDEMDKQIKLQASEAESIDTTDGTEERPADTIPNLPMVMSEKKEKVLVHV